VSAWIDLARYLMVPLGVAILLGLAVGRWTFNRPKDPPQS